MRGEQHLTNKKQFEMVYREGSSLAGRALVVRAAANGLGFSRYGLVVSRRIGNAVTRNRVKRLLREIVRQTLLRPGWDIVLIARLPAAKESYLNLHKSVKALLSRASLLAGEHEEVSPRPN